MSKEDKKEVKSAEKGSLGDYEPIKKWTLLQAELRETKEEKGKDEQRRQD